MEYSEVNGVTVNSGNVCCNFDGVLLKMCQFLSILLVTFFFFVKKKRIGK